jgi:hypothetical protein
MMDEDLPMDELVYIRNFPEAQLITPVKAPKGGEDSKADDLLDLKSRQTRSAVRSRPGGKHQNSEEKTADYHKSRQPQVVTPDVSKSDKKKNEALVQRVRKEVGDAEKKVEHLTALLERETHPADRGGGHLVTGDEPSPSVPTSSIDVLTNAIRKKATRKPDNLSKGESGLWDVVQDSLFSQRSDFIAKRRILERQLQQSTSQLDKLRVQNMELQKDLDKTNNSLKNTKFQLNRLKSSQTSQHNMDNDGASQVRELEDQLADVQKKYDAAVESAEKLQVEHDRAICAIQRVLADVNEENDVRLSKLHAEIDQLRSGSEATVENEKLDSTVQSFSQLKKDVNLLKEKTAHVAEERIILQSRLDEKSKQLSILEQELRIVKNALTEAKEKEKDFMNVIQEQKSQLEKQVQAYEISSISEEAQEVCLLRNMFEEKLTSLENAKKLIASLELANGTMTKDLRSKLKVKEGQILTLQSENADRKRVIDNLTAELKSFQNKEARSTLDTEQHKQTQQILSQKLESSISDLQSSIVVLEASGAGDEDALEQISEILSSTLVALKISLTAIESSEPLDDEQVKAFNGARDPPSRDFQEAFRMKDSNLKYLEDNLKTTAVELKQLRLQNERLQQGKNKDTTALEKELLELREKYQSSLETLSRKDSELQDLQRILDVGQHVRHHGSSRAIENNSSAEELLVALKRAQRDAEIAKEELKTEQESLANAKMIISSLEKANKTMLEDLRSRLQDSNNAIAGLLEKSVTNEKLAKQFKEELDRVKREKLTSEATHKQEIARMKDEALVSALRLAAKEREITGLLREDNKKEDS